MEDQIHGHEVLKMLSESDEVFTRESLIADMKEKFGADAKFCTCSFGDMPPEKMVDFFLSRGKFMTVPGGFKFDAGNACHH
jgi:probable metal-binding protein